MCGISAIVSRSPEQRAKVLDLMATQKQRGPDDSNYVYDGHCALGHNRLSLLDLGPTGQQPMRLGRFTITYNGEVYNHQDLRRLVKGHTWRGTSDTETILVLIDRFGINATLNMLNGMFAFAVWDSELGFLTVATDRFGVKPLYVYHEDGVLACASSSAALLHLKDQWEVDDEGMRQFFHLGGSARGVWKGIERIGGGQIITYDAGRNNILRNRWYTPTFNPNAAEELEYLITDAIRISAKADVPVGIFYSGGVDTSVVASVVATGFQPVSAEKRIHTFHLDGPELPYASAGALHFGMLLHLVDPDQIAVVPALKDIAAKSGEPTMAGYIPWLVSRTAAEYVKACISGNGADELFFGYDRTARTSEVADLQAQGRHMFRQWLPESQWPVFTLPVLSAGPWPACASSRWAELHWYVQHDLNPTLDAASMCHSLELRVPFLDHRVVEAALSLPASFHGTKRVLKDMLRKAGLPESFVERKKLGFSMPPTHPGVKEYKLEAWAMACRHFGWNPNAVLSPRDRNYLHLCAAGWRAWMDVHQHRIAA